MLGRPKGSKNIKTKLSDKKDIVRMLLDKNTSKKSIYKKLKIRFPTLKRFIDKNL